MPRAAGDGLFGCCLERRSEVGARPPVTPAQARPGGGVPPPVCAWRTESLTAWEACWGWLLARDPQWHVTLVVPGAEEQRVEVTG